MFTFFQIMTGDSWASMVVRSLVEEQESSGRGTDPRSIYFFFVSFVLIAGVVLVNIVVAVLLDEFINAMQKEKEKASAIIREKKEIDAKASRISGVLDPLLQSLSSFNDNNDLTAKVQDLYSRLDADGGGALDFKELNAGLKELALSKPIHLIEDDFDVGLTLQMTETTDLYRDQHTAWSYPLVLPVAPEKKYFSKIVSDAYMYNSDRYKYGSNAAYAAAKYHEYLRTQAEYLEQMQQESE